MALLSLMDATMGFSDSNEISKSSSICCVASNTETLSSEPLTPPDVSALSRLSANLESLLDSPGSDHFSDAKIIVSSSSSCNDREIPVHRCILAARSPFFKNLFVGSAKEISGAAEFQLKELAKDHPVGVDALEAVLAYMYSGKVRPLPKEVCVCVDEDCPHVACRPVVDFMVEVLYASSTFQISQLVALHQRKLLNILDKVAIDDVLLVLSVANICGKACERLLERCIEVIAKSDVDIITLDKSLPQDPFKQIVNSRIELGLGTPERDTFPDKHVKRIHRALDSDDVELVRMLLKEGHTALDDAFALHYAVAYCDTKTTTELLDLGVADVNHKNRRGYTVLHVAAMRKEPKIIVSLLTKGARPSDLTLDGRNALQISKRLTKAIDYYRSTDEGKASPKDRLCIEILEQAERREPVLGEASLSLSMVGDALRVKILYLESRVGLAKVLFPMEAKVAMDIAQVDRTSEFPLGIKSKNLGEAQITAVDLNEAPFEIQEEHLLRLRALSRTVDLGKRFFPRCSEVLDRIMDADDISELASLGNDNFEERLLKRQRFMELQDDVKKAFNEDKEDFDRSVTSSSASSTSIRLRRPHGKLTIKK